MWPLVHTRPDISYSVGVLSRYCANPGLIHCNFVIQIFRYLAGTLDLGITFESDTTDELVEYTDSSWAGLKDGRRSTGRYSFILSGVSPIQTTNYSCSIFNLGRLYGNYRSWKRSLVDRSIFSPFKIQTARPAN